MNKALAYIIALIIPLNSAVCTHKVIVHDPRSEDLEGRPLYVSTKDGHEYLLTEYKFTENEIVGYGKRITGKGEGPQFSGVRLPLSDVKMVRVKKPDLITPLVITGFVVVLAVHLLPFYCIIYSCD